MPSPLTTATDTIEAMVAALTPPDRTAVVYALYNGRGEPDGESADRVFWFGVPTRAAPMAERGAALTQIEWSIDFRCRLSANPHNRTTLIDAVANESILLRRAFDNRATSWGSGVLEIIAGDATTELDQQDVIITIPLRVLTEET